MLKIKLSIKIGKRKTHTKNIVNINAEKIKSDKILTSIILGKKLNLKQNIEKNQYNESI